MSEFKNTRLGYWWYNQPVVTRNLLLINIVMFIFTLFNQEYMIRTFAMFYPQSPFFHPWQILTHMFMHGGFWHIFFNMYTLFIFGLVLERAIGSKKFLVFYFLTGLGAVALHTLVQYLEIHGLGGAAEVNAEALARIIYTPTVGASGAIYGILIGYAMMYPDSVLTLIFPPISLKAKWFVIIFAVIELLFGVTGSMDSVAHFAHLGGMLFGWLIMLWWKKTGRIYERDNWI